tara:strand:+ start:1941 stop:2234 length:294 start_codon:yes stop_codon:yes gene_type:complete
MSEEKVTTEEELHTNPMLAMPVNPNSELKNYLVEYVGTKLDNEEVTVNMIAEVLATDFPEFMFAFAEENFLRGYQLGLDDAESLFTKQTEAAVGTTD